MCPNTQKQRSCWRSGLGGLALLPGLLWSGQAGPAGRERGCGKAVWRMLCYPGSRPWLWGSHVGLQRDDSRCGLLLWSHGWLLLCGCHLSYIATANAQLCGAWGRTVGHFPFIGFFCKLLLVGLICSRSHQGQGWVGVRWRVSSALFWLVLG